MRPIFAKHIFLHCAYIFCPNITQISTQYVYSHVINTHMSNLAYSIPIPPLMYLHTQTLKTNVYWCLLSLSQFYIWFAFPAEKKWIVFGSKQCCIVTKFLYSSTAFKYTFKESLLYWSILTFNDFLCDPLLHSLSTK